MRNIFDNEITWIAICICTFWCFYAYFDYKRDIEKEHTKQLEIQLQISTNNVKVINVEK